MRNPRNLMNENYPPSTYCLQRKSSDDNSVAKFILEAHVCAHESRTHRKDKREKKTQLIEVKPRIGL